MGVRASPKSRRDGRNQGMVSLVWSVAKIWHGMSLVWSGLVGLVWLVQLVWLVWFAGLVRLRQPSLPGSIGRGPRGAVLRPILAAIGPTTTATSFLSPPSWRRRRPRGRRPPAARGEWPSGTLDASRIPSPFPLLPPPPLPTPSSAPPPAPAHFGTRLTRFVPSPFRHTPHAFRALPISAHASHVSCPLHFSAPLTRFSRPFRSHRTQ